MMHQKYLTLSLAIAFAIGAVSSTAVGEEAVEESVDAFTQLHDSYNKARAKHGGTMAQLEANLASATTDETRAMAQSAIDKEHASFESGLESIKKKLDVLDPPAPEKVVDPAPPAGTDGAAPPVAPLTAKERAAKLDEKLMARFKKLKEARGDKDGDGAPGKSGEAGRENAPGQIKEDGDGDPRAKGKGQH